MFEYIGPDEKDPHRIIGRAIDGSGMYALRIDAVMQPEIVGEACHDDAGDNSTHDDATCNDDTVCSGAGSERVGDLPLTTEQRRMIFGLGKSKGLDIDVLRAMTPQGSISALTRTEAGQVIDRLVGKPGWSHLHRGNGTATGKQLGLIEHLRDQLRFDCAQFSEWLQRQFKVHSLAEIDDGDLASRVIGGLMGMQRNRSRRRATGTRR